MVIKDLVFIFSSVRAFVKSISTENTVNNQYCTYNATESIIDDIENIEDE
jgi:hypothetical protein